MLRNKRLIFIALSYLAIFASASFAKVKTYKIRQKIFKLYTPHKWQVAPHFLGSELTFLGEYKNGRRPVLAIKYTPLKNYPINEQELESSQYKYQTGRKAWLKKNKGTLINFFSYQKIDWQKKKNVHSIGYKYFLHGHQFIEMNYFFKCREHLFNLSTLMTTIQYKENKNIIKTFMNHLQC